MTREVWFISQLARSNVKCHGVTPICPVHLWADLSRKKCAWAQAYYQAHRAKGQSHATAVRCLGQRWLKILWTMWQSGTSYDESLHLRNQIKHGNWLLSLKIAAPKPASQTA